MGHELPEFTDRANESGVNKILTITAGAVEILKVGIGPLSDREFVLIEAQSKDIKFGFDPLVQPFNCFKNQFFILPFGENVTIYFKNNGSTSATVSIGEVN